MNVFRLVKFAVLASASVLAAASYAATETFTLSTGEIIKGVAEGEKDGVLSLKTQYGTISVPVASVAKRELDATKEQSAQAQVAEKAPEPQAPKKPTIDDVPPPEDKDPEWVEDYRNFVEQHFPEGWQFRLRGGLELKKTDAETFSVYAAFDVKKEWDVNIFAATVFYNYATQTDSAGVDSKTIDNYGARTTYKRFFNETKTWYISNFLNYKKDPVKQIVHEIDESLTFGYRFDFKRYNLTIDIGPGPGVRYIESSVDGVETVATALVQEDLNWVISKTFRAEQNFVATLDLNQSDKYSVLFKAALVAHMTKVMDLAIRYSVEYDTISSSTVKTEQRLIIAFEFPFNWQ